MLLEKDKTVYICISQGITITDFRRIVRLVRLPDLKVFDYDAEKVYDMCQSAGTDVVFNLKVSRSDNDRFDISVTRGEDYPSFTYNKDGDLCPTPDRNYYTVLARVTKKELKTFTKWNSEGMPTDYKRWVPKHYYYVSDFDGVVGYVDEESLLELCIRCTLTNVEIKDKRIHAMFKKDVTAEDFIDLPEELDLSEHNKHLLATLGDVYTGAHRLDGVVRKSEFVKLTDEQKQKCMVLSKVAQSFTFEDAFGSLPVVVRFDGLEEEYTLSSLYARLFRSEVYRESKAVIDACAARASFLGMLTKNDLDYILGFYDSLDIDPGAMQAILEYYRLSNLEEELFEGFSDPAKKAQNFLTFTYMEGEARNVYFSALKQQFKITNLIKHASRMCDAKLTGLEHKIKGPVSFSEKVNGRALANGLDPENAAREATDILRYTFVIPADEYKKKSEEALLILLDAADAKYITNYWNIENKPYMGINAAFCHKELSVNFEVQFHTPESFAFKDGEVHKLYEEQRAPGTSDKRKKELDVEMLKLAANVSIPKGAKTITLENLSRRKRTDKGAPAAVRITAAAP